MCYCKPCVYELLLDKLELIGTDATDRAHVVLGQFGRVDLYLITANGSYELIRLLLLSHDVLLSNVTAGVLHLSVYVLNNIMQVLSKHF